MANEIQHNISLSLSNSGLTENFAPGQIQVTQSAQLKFSTVLSITTSDTDLSALITNVTTYGVCVLYNLDPTNYVDIGATSGGAIIPLIRLKPKGDVPAVFRLKPGITLRGQANTGTCKVLVIVLND